MRRGEALELQWLWLWRWGAFVLSALVAAWCVAIWGRIWVKSKQTRNGSTRSRRIPVPSGSLNIDGALSDGHRHSWESLGEIQPCLKEEHEDDSKRLQSELRYLKAKYSDLEKELKRSEEGKANSERKLACIKKELWDVTEKFEDLQKKLVDATEKREDVEKELLDVRNQLRDLISLLRMAELRELLTKFKSSLHGINAQLKTIARPLYSKKFPEEPISATTYTGWISKLVKENPRGKDAKLRCLRKVAMNYNWSQHKRFEGKGLGKEFGKQFYDLCISVSELNDGPFHPNIVDPEKEKIRGHASERSYMFRNRDLNLVATVLLDCV